MSKTLELYFEDEEVDEFAGLINRLLYAMVYQYYMKASADCAYNARVALGRKDISMFKFWSNASREFERRARNV